MTSSVVWRHVGLVRTNVSEERILFYLGHWIYRSSISIALEETRRKQRIEVSVYTQPKSSSMLPPPLPQANDGAIPHRWQRNTSLQHPVYEPRRTVWVIWGQRANYCPKSERRVSVHPPADTEVRSARGHSASRPSDKIIASARYTVTARFPILRGLGHVWMPTARSTAMQSPLVASDVYRPRHSHGNRIAGTVHSL
jgi:hypothetical protein